jgi:mono/diheme cytochrome c family protein
MAHFRPIPPTWGLLLALAALLGCERSSGKGDERAEAKRHFESLCAKCHGRDGRGGFPAAEGLPAPSNFTDPAFHIRRRDSDLEHAIRNGKGPMPPFGRVFDEAQTRALVAYVRAFNASATAQP